MWILKEKSKDISMLDMFEKQQGSRYDWKRINKEDIGRSGTVVGRDGSDNIGPL